MKIIDLRKRTDKVSPKYMDVPQPMYAYDSTDEFKENQSSYMLLTNMIEFTEFIKNFTDILKQDDHQDFVLLKEYNVWIATGEKFIPEVCNIFGHITYRTTDDHKLVPTDNTYIRLFGVQRFKNMFLTYTSTGVFPVSMVKWEFTAAVKDQFVKTKTGTKGAHKQGYDEKLETLLNRKKATVQDAITFNLLMNPLSSTFMNADAAVGEAYGMYIKKKDRHKLIETTRFRDFFISQLGKIMPDLVKDIRKNVSTDDIGKFIKQMMDKAIENGSVDDQEKALGIALKTAYAEDLLQLATRDGQNIPLTSSSDSIPMVLTEGEGKNNIPEAPKGSSLISEYDETSDASVTKEEPQSELSEEEYKEAFNSAGIPDGYIQDKPKEDD